MRRPTHAALALAGATALVLPGSAAAAPDSPEIAPVAGHGTLRELAMAARYEIRRDRARRSTLKLARRAERLTGLDLPADYRVRLADDSLSELASRRQRLRGVLRADSFPKVAKPAALKAIAACESGGDYSTNTGNGFYGAYQFDLGTWASVGGSGLPSEASPAEQDARAALLYARAGAAPWPVCGR